jgi:hypothetical protein
MNVKAFVQTAVSVVGILLALKLAARFVPGADQVRNYVLK